MNARTRATAAVDDPPRALRGGEPDSTRMCTPCALKKAAVANMSPRGWRNGDWSAGKSALLNPRELTFTRPRACGARRTVVRRSRAMFTVQGPRCRRG